MEEWVLDESQFAYVIIVILVIWIILGYFLHPYFEKGPKKKKD